MFSNHRSQSARFGHLQHRKVIIKDTPRDLAQADHEMQQASDYAFECIDTCTGTERQTLGEEESSLTVTGVMGHQDPQLFGLAINRHLFVCFRKI